MARFTIDGETHDVDVKKLGLHEVIAVQRATGYSMEQLVNGLVGKDAVALAAYIWIILRRNGEDVTWAQIESGERYIDIAAIQVEHEPDPTEAAEVALPTTSTEGESAISPLSPISAT